MANRRREVAASTIQECWRRHTAPPLVSREQALHFSPAVEYLDAEAASRIQAAWRGVRGRKRVYRELRVLEQLAEPIPPSAQAMLWPSALKLCVTLLPLLLPLPPLSVAAVVVGATSCTDQSCFTARTVDRLATAGLTHALFAYAFFAWLPQRGQAA